MAPQSETMKTETALKILIADDHALVRAGLALALAEGFPGARVAECDTWASVHRCIDARHFDLILLDLFMPRRQAWEDELRRLTAAVSDTAVCILSASAEPAHIRAAVAAGVRAYLTKTLDLPEIRAQLGRVLAGERVLPDLTGPAPVPADAGPNPVLTPRQRELLERLAAGASNRCLAEAMSLTESTVKRHVHNICRRLGAGNRVEAVALARAAGLLNGH